MRLLNRFKIIVIGILLTVGMLACGVDDLTLTSRVKANLAAQKTIPADSIKVTVQEGVVTLSGVVNSDAEKSKAEEIAKAVEGVSVRLSTSSQ